MVQALQAQVRLCPSIWIAAFRRVCCLTCRCRQVCLFRVVRLVRAGVACEPTGEIAARRGCKAARIAWLAAHRPWSLLRTMVSGVSTTRSTLGMTFARKNIVVAGAGIVVGRKKTMVLVSSTTVARKETVVSGSSTMMFSLGTMIPAPATTVFFPPTMVLAANSTVAAAKTNEEDCAHHGVCSGNHGLFPVNHGAAHDVCGTGGGNHETEPANHGFFSVDHDLFSPRARMGRANHDVFAAHANGLRRHAAQFIDRRPFRAQRVARGLGWHRLGHRHRVASLPHAAVFALGSNSMVDGQAGRNYFEDAAGFLERFENILTPSPKCSTKPSTRTVGIPNIDACSRRETICLSRVDT